jgi:aminopeptidase N
LKIRSLAVASFVAAASLNAQVPRQRVAPTYEPGIDVLDYDITVELPDTGAFIRGDVTVTFRRSPNVSRLVLDLVDALVVRSVEVGGHVVAATHTGNKVDIPLDGTRDSLRVRVRYDGVVSDGLISRKDAQGRWTWFGDNWPNRARQWLPTVDHPSDKATVSWRVLTPAGRTVVANGLPVSTSASPGSPRTTETRWRESRPIATYLMVIAAGPLERFDLPEANCHVGDARKCVKQSVYVMPENIKWLPGVFTAAGPIVTLFETLVGPFPYEKLAHLQSSTRFGGMENASEIFYDGKLFDTHRMSEGLIAHETAHQWFGDAVTEREWAHLWLSEGFATYFAALWTKTSRGDAAYHAEMAAIRKQVLGSRVVAERPVIDTAQTDYLKLLNANSYQKGGYILYMLHQQIGDSAFFGGLKSYYATYRNGNALSDDLRLELERSSHRSLKQYFDQWLRRPGVAEPAMGWNYDSSANTISVHVVQKNANGAYELAVPVLITDAAGVTSRATVNVPAQADVTITLPNRYASRPRSLVFDPDERLLARITPL